MIDEILSYNRDFVARKAYEPYVTDKYPARKLAVLTCMDTRLTELLPQALGLRNGDAKIIKNAGGLVLSETDSAIRSLLVAIYELSVEEVMVVHHSSCGACHMNYGEFKPLMLSRGISEETLADWESKGVAEWLEGFHDTEASVRKTVAAVRHHPLMPKDVVVRGFIIDSVTGALTEISCLEGPLAEAAVRVDAMSRSFDLVCEAMRPFRDGPDRLDGSRLQEARKAVRPLRDTVDSLNEYQRSGLWLKDFEAEEAGLLPDDISRSVLSEDGLYNLLEDIDFLLDT